MASASYENWSVSWSGDVSLARPDEDELLQEMMHEPGSPSANVTITARLWPTSIQGRSAENLRPGWPDQRVHGRRLTPGRPAGDLPSHFRPGRARQDDLAAWLRDRLTLECLIQSV